MTGPLQRRHNLHQQLRDNEEHIQLLEQQIQAVQKLASLGTTACLVAHEFNNLLTPMINYAELALRHEDDLDLMRKALEKTIKHGNRAALIIQSMLGLVRNSDQQAQKVNLAAAVEECFHCLARDLNKDRIHVRQNISPDLHVWMVPAQLQQVLLNMVINARQAMLKTGGSLNLTAHQKDERVILEITDTGCGIDSELLEKIFEPFFTTKTSSNGSSTQGTGLGLSICRDIIESYQGTITVQSQSGQGTTFIINLPGRPPADDSNSPR